MSKVNRKNTQASLNGLMVSKNGNLQSVKPAEQELFEIAVSTMYGNVSYYETSDDILARMKVALYKVVDKGNLDFVANLIVYARTVMNIRTMPVLLAVWFAKALRERNIAYMHLRHIVADTIQRAGQITDFYAASLDAFGNKKAVPMAIKRGVADGFNKFDEFRFAKVPDNGAVKFRDVLRIVHPVPKDEQQGEIFAKIMNGNLAVPYTWEAELSMNGQKLEAERKSKKDLWTELVASGKMGYMALLRNLRNIVEAGVDTSVIRDYVAPTLMKPANVAKSRQFPFAFMNALDNLPDNADASLVQALAKAMDLSVANVPKLGEHVWVIIDVSGSMGWAALSRRNPPIKTAMIFAAALAKANADSKHVALTVFSDHAKHVSVDARKPVVEMVEVLKGNIYGGGTNLQAALDLKGSLGFEPDTVIVLSDMEVNRLTSHNVASLFRADAVKIAINLESGKSTPLGEKDGWYQLAGWNERIFDLIPAMREGETIVSSLSQAYLGAAKITNIGGVVTTDETETA